MKHILLLLNRGYKRQIYLWVYILSQLKAGRFWVRYPTSLWLWVHTGLGDTQESAVCRRKPSEKFQTGSYFQADWSKAHCFVCFIFIHLL